jgi:predicted phosphodiesterase
MHRRILVIGDTHFPFQHPNFFKDLKHHLTTFKPDTVVHMGDMADIHSISRHEPDPECPDPMTEIAQANTCVRNMVKLIGKKVRVYVCLGNHDSRIEKMAARNGIPRAFLKNWRDLFCLPTSWQVAFEHHIDGISFLHGKSPVRGKTTLAYGCNTVQGHFHSKLGIEYHQGPRRMLWSAFSGGSVDDDSLAMAYGRNNLEKGAYGFLLIEDGIPRIVPGTKC